MSFGSRIKNARENKKLSQQQLANLLNVTDGSISNYEKGVAYPRWEAIKKICSILDVDPNYLFWDDLSVSIKDKIIKQNNLSKYHLLTESGRKKVDEYIDDLLNNPTYVKSININEAERKSAASRYDRLEIAAYGGEGNKSPKKRYRETT